MQSHYSPPDNSAIESTGLNLNMATEDFTIFCLAQGYTNSVDNQVLFGIDPGSGTRMWFGALSISDGTFRNIRSNGSGGNTSISLQLSNTFGSWFHVIFTFDASTDTVSTYFNGKKYTDITDAGFTISGDLVIGGNQVGGTREWHGRMAQIGVFKNAYQRDPSIDAGAEGDEQLASVAVPTSVGNIHGQRNSI